MPGVALLTNDVYAGLEHTRTALPQRTAHDHGQPKRKGALYSSISHVSVPENTRGYLRKINMIGLLGSRGLMEYLFVPQYGPNWNFDTKCNNGIKTELKFPSWQVGSAEHSGLVV